MYQHSNVYLCTKTSLEYCIVALGWYYIVSGHRFSNVPPKRHKSQDVNPICVCNVFFIILAMKLGVEKAPTMLMNPPAPSPRRGMKDKALSPSTAIRKVGLNPPAPTRPLPKAANKTRRRKSRSSSTGSSGSSSSSHSSYSSSSGSSKSASPPGTAVFITREVGLRHPGYPDKMQTTTSPNLLTGISHK